MIENTGFISHLIELRARLLRVLVAWLVVFIALYPFAGPLYSQLAAPLLHHLPAGGQMIATAVTAPFLIPLKLAMLTALLLTFPVVLYQLWRFIAPGLYGDEKRFVLWMMLAGSALFLLGMVFVYYLVLPIIFGFILKVAPLGVAVMTDIGEYLDFVMTLFIAFGLAFEMPVVVLIAVRLGWVSLTALQQARGYVIVATFMVAAVLTPPDVLSQLMLAVPMCLLYELALLMARGIHASPSHDILPREDL